MTRLMRLSLASTEPEYLAQVRYALAFLSDDVVAHNLEESGWLQLEIKEEADDAEIRRRVEELAQRYAPGDGFRTDVVFEQARELPVVDAWAGLLDRRWVTPVGEGHVILRGPAAQLLEMIDRKVRAVFGKEFRAETEWFPATIASRTLDRCNHFTSFPEHVDFVAHLKEDLNVLREFADKCRTDGWSADLHRGRMADSDFAISPSCCYHAYEGMEGWNLEKPGRCITAILHCHRYEGSNQAALSRLRAFTMREIIFVGHPSYVIESRARAEELIVEWARDWELACRFETANDMFFTDDYAVKASFQRQQQAKRELRLLVPTDKKSISVFSTNFHAASFGKAFDIKVGGRPATSGCIAWGYERWVYAVFSQFGFDMQRWPEGLRRDFERFGEP